MNSKLIDALDRSIKLMEAGVPLSECIMRYPDLAPELHNLLTTAEFINYLSVEDIEPEQMNRSRMKILSRAKRLNSINIRSSKDSPNNRILHPIGKINQILRTLTPLATRLIVASGIAGFLILFYGGLLDTSAKALPGDTLYPIKRVVEDIRVHFAPSVELKHEFEDNYSQKRVDEVQQLLGLARVQQISFEGTVNSKNDTQWLVSGIPVNIQTNSLIVRGTEDLEGIE
jgi:hypothetical protein